VERLKGTVKWFNNAKGYGFLGREDGPDVFIHYSSITTEGYKSLQEGDQVEFEMFKDKRAAGGQCNQDRLIEAVFEARACGPVCSHDARAHCVFQPLPTPCCSAS